MSSALPILILLPLIAAAAVIFAPARKAKWIAFWGTVLPLAYYVYLAFFAPITTFDWTSDGATFLKWSAEWLPSVGVKLSLGADVISMLLIGLTVFLGPIIMAGSFTAVDETSGGGNRLKTYYGWLLVLQAAMTGVFAARDVILFYVFFEFTLVPLYILINLFGSTNRKAAATKFFLYTFTGSMITLASIVYVAYVAVSKNPHGTWAFDFDTIMTAAQGMTAGEQWLVFWGLMAGFAVKVPLFPVHTWLPLAHTEAPTAGSVVLAGVLLKLGTYGILRFALGMVPEAVVAAAPIVGVLCIIGILYAGLICWVQTDVKKLVAYSSVSHLGFCVLGLFALNTVGITGSILYMINHGLSTGALFLLIGMIYERYHTRSMKELGGLAARMPVWAFFMVFFTMASVGLPGLNGFVSEFMCLMGTFQSDGATLPSWNEAGAHGALVGATPGVLGPWYAFAAGTGMIVGAMYLLYMLGKVVWGPLVEPAGHGHAGHGAGGDGAAGHGTGGHGDHHDHHAVKDLSAREIGVLLPLAAACLVLGIYPKPILHVLEQPTQAISTLLQAKAEEARQAAGEHDAHEVTPAAHDPHTHTETLSDPKTEATH